MATGAHSSWITINTSHTCSEHTHLSIANLNVNIRTVTQTLVHIEHRLPFISHIRVVKINVRQ